MHNSGPAAEGDEAKIRAAALDDIGGVLEADPARIERCLHPDLAKRADLRGAKLNLGHLISLCDRQRPATTSICGIKMWTFTGIRGA